MNPGRKVIRRMGYLRDQRGIMDRYLEERGGWNAHLERTKQFIAEAFGQSGIKSVAVLGSGWLLDVPLENLTKRFENVYLADVYHPPQIRRKVRDMPGVELVETDLSGGAISRVWKICRKKEPGLLSRLHEWMHLEFPLEGIRYDAVISVNLLNQLDILLVDFMRKHGCLGDASADGLRILLQSHHLEWITRTPGCLVTDVRETNTDQSRNETTRELAFAPLPPGSRTGEWTWEFDSLGTYRKRCHTRMLVRGVEWP